MKIKRIVSYVLALSMLLPALPTMAWEDSEQMADAKVYYHVDFNKLEEGTSEIPGWVNSKGPEMGTVTIEKPSDSENKAICINDIDANDGPYLSASLPAITGRKTVRFRYFTGHHCGLQFTSNGTLYMSCSFSSNGDLLVSNNKTSTYEKPLPNWKLPKSGKWIDVSISFDMKKKKADFFMYIDGFKDYMGSLGPHSRMIDGVLYIPGIPLQTNIVDNLNLNHYKGTGKGYFEYLTIYEGLHAPIVLPEESTGGVTDIKKPLKAPWISRTQSINNYAPKDSSAAQDTKTDALNIPGRLTPLPLEIEKYLPEKNQIKNNMEMKKGQHPRLLLDEAGWEKVRAKIDTPVGADIYKRLIEEVDALILEPLYVFDPNDNGTDETQRYIGNYIAYFSFAYKLTGEKKYFDAAYDWTMMACDLAAWGKNNSDLAAGHILEGIAYFYDWCFYDLDANDRKFILDNLIQHGSPMYRAATSIPRTWTKAYKQNHNWINNGGLAAAAAAIYDEYDEAYDWLAHAAENYSYVMDTLGDDGYGHEGIGYWGYGLVHILLYLDLARSVYGLDLYDHEWLKNTAFYRIYMSYSQSGWGYRNNFGFADAWQFDYNGPESLMRKLAGEYNIPQAQWFAREAVEKGINKEEDAWLALMWYNPEVGEESIVSLPTLRYFEDHGAISARADWSGNESALYMRCGPYLGFLGGGKSLSLEKHRLGEGHMQPDNNHFILYANGEVLIKDDGYNKKFTNTHNTLLVNGKGQKGDDDTWFNSMEDAEISTAKPEMKKVISADEYDYFVGDATQAYPMNSGLEKFYRHMVYLKKQNALLVIDDIRTDEIRPLELRLFPYSENIFKITDNEFLITSSLNNLHIKELTPTGVTTKAEKVKVVKNISGSTTNSNAITIKADKKEWLNATSLAWAPAGQMPNMINCSQSGSVFTFAVGDKRVVVDTSAMNVELSDAGMQDGANADLTSILINSRPLEDFKSQVTQYTYNPDADARLVRMNMKDYNIMPFPSSPMATVTVDLPEKINQKVVIHVTSPDKTVTKDYVIQFTGKMFGGLQVPIVNAFADESGEGTAPEYTLDGDFVSYWTADGKGKYITFDLGEVRDLMGVDIAWMRGNVRQAYFDIALSLDGENFTTVYSGQSSGKYLEPEFHEFDTITPARYIRMIGYGNSAGNTWNSVTEFGAYISNEITATLNGKKISFDTHPKIVNDRVMVPMRAVFEAFGAGVSWDSPTKTVYAVSGSTIMKLPVGSTSAVVGDKTLSLDVAPVLEEGRVLVPIRFVAESLGANVEWNGEKRMVIIQN